MANKLDPMDIKQILHLIKDGYSNRKIGATLGISRNTVNSYVRQFSSSKHSVGELLSFDESRLNELFTSKTTIDTVRHNDLMHYFERINLSCGHPGFTFLHHYNEYVNNTSNPYSYTQFMEHYNRKYSTEKGSLKLEHLAGHEMFVDFAGRRLEIVDRASGEVQPVEVFIAILPCSLNYSCKYVEVYYNHQRITLHQRNQTQGSYNTIADHLSSNHRLYIEWSPEYFKNKAAAHGSHLVKCVEHILASVDYPEIGYKRVTGLLQLHKAYGSNRLDRACQIALDADMVSYSRVKNILKNNMDKAYLFFDKEDQSVSHIPIHNNIRGAASYK